MPTNPPPSPVPDEASRQEREGAPRRASADAQEAPEAVLRQHPPSAAMSPDDRKRFERRLDALFADGFAGRMTLWSLSWRDNRVRSQIETAREGLGKGFWTPAQFADWATDWAKEDRAGEHWPADAIDWLAKCGARFEEGPAESVALAGARTGRLGWLATGWEKAREEEAAAQALADAAAEEALRRAQASPEEPGPPAAAGKSLFSQRRAPAPAKPSGWRWTREWPEKPGQMPIRKSEPSLGRTRSAREFGSPEELWAGQGWGEKGAARKIAAKAVFAAARAGQLKALAWLERKALPVAEHPNLWDFALSAALQGGRPRTMAWIGRKLPGGEPPSGALSKKELAEGSPGPWPAMLSHLARKGSAKQIGGALAQLRRETAAGKWPAKDFARWASGKEDLLRLLLDRTLSPDPEGPKIAALLTRSGWEWSQSKALEDALLQTRCRAGLGAHKGITWPSPAAGLDAVKRLGVGWSGQEAQAAACAAASASPAAMEWALKNALPMNEPARAGRFQGKTAVQVAQERLDSLRPDPFRPGEPEALRQFIAWGEKEAIEAAAAKGAAQSQGNAGGQPGAPRPGRGAPRL